MFLQCLAEYLAHNLCSVTVYVFFFWADALNNPDSFCHIHRLHHYHLSDRDRNLTSEIKNKKVMCRGKKTIHKDEGRRHPQGKLHVHTISGVLSLPLTFVLFFYPCFIPCSNILMIVTLAPLYIIGDATSSHNWVYL